MFAVHLKKLQKALGVKKISMPKENIIIKVFKIKPGAITAFGKLHKVETVVDKSLLKTKDVILQAGSFTDSVRMKVKDFIELEEARLESFAERAGYTVPAKPVKKKKAAAKKKPTPKKKPTAKKKSATKKKK